MTPGYEVTYRDFQRLVSDPYCVAMVAPLLKQWFNHDIVTVGPAREKFGNPETEIHDATGKIVDKMRLHLWIQADPDMQTALYQTSQTLWR